jgi:hypothetical protein
MSGFHYAVAKSFKVKPVLELFKAKGSVTAKAARHGPRRGSRQIC